MKEIKKSVWGLPLIGGIITLIALLTPAAYVIYRSPSFTNDFFLWMCSLFFSHRFEMGIYTTRIEFDIQLISLIPSIICSLIIAILSMVTIITANKYRKGTIDINVSWVVSAVVIIFTTIIWMVMMEISRRVLYGHGFWGLFSPGFGVIVPFLGAGLEIVGYILLKKSLRN
ncbi:MAG: hypothetical protein ACW972_01490 [Promethearchaeota archaeon]|jgi:hypothetical protein